MSAGGCQKEVGFATEAEAWAELFRIALRLPTAAQGRRYIAKARHRDRDHADRPVAVHRCGWAGCDRWHLTSMYQPAAS